LTSASAAVIGTGGKAFTTNLAATATAFVVGQRVRAANTATPSNYMEGIVTSFSGTNIIINVDATGGTGTFSGWTFSAAGNAGATGATGATGPTGGGAVLPISSADISFLQAGTGAVVRTGQAKYRDFVSVLDFGAVGNGVTDDTTAIQNALGTGKNVYLPPGNYLVSNPGLSMVSNGQRMYGESGAGWLTIIEWNGTSGNNAITISGLQHCIIESINIRRNPSNSVNLTSGYGVSFANNAYFCEVRTCKITGTGNGISITGTGNQVIDCEMREFSGTYGIRYYGTSVLPGLRAVLDRVLIDNNLIITNISATSPAVITTTHNHGLSTGNTITIDKVSGTGGIAGINGSRVVTVLTPNTLSVSYNAVGTTYNAYSGYMFGPNNFIHLVYDSYVHSLIVTACAFLWGGTAVYMTDYANTTDSYPTWLHAFDLECDHQWNSAVILNGGEGCFITTSWIGSSLSGNGLVTMPPSPSTGVSGWRGELLLSNSRIMGNAQTGILLNGGVDACINNCAIGDNGGQTPNTYNGITVASGVSKFSITGNKIGDAIGTTFNGQAYGVYIFSGGSDYYQVIGNILYGNTVGQIGDFGNGSNKIVQNTNTNGGGMTFSGQVQADNAAFIGAITSASLTATGIVAANAINAVGQVAGNNVYVTSSADTAIRILNGGGLQATGKVAGNTVAAVGAITGASLTATGAVAGNTVAAVGQVSGGSAYITSASSTAIQVVGGGGISVTGPIAAATVAATGQVSGGSVYVNSSSGTAMQVVGSPSYALDFNGMTSTGKVRLKDGQQLTFRNAANTGDSNALFTVSDGLVIGNSGFTATYINTALYPLYDNTFQTGGTSNRWSAVWAVNGTIQTSDPSLKTDISPLPTALPIVADIDPVTFKWISGGKIAEKKITQKKVPAPSGKGFVTEDVEETVYVDRPGKRRHWGFLASDVKAAFDKIDVDFGGYVKDENGIEHLRPDQLIPVLWKAVQELKAEIDVLKASKS
jgi:hypothetical protein